MPKTKDWTIMVYLAGDNNLSEDMITSLRGLQKAMQPKGSDNNINLVAIYDSTYPTVKITRYHFTHKNSNAPLKDCQINKNQVRSVKNPNDTLYIKSFVKWAMRKWNAQNYALIMSGHSDAILGKTMFRDDNPQSVLSLSKVSKYLRKALPAGKKLSVLGFDSCMMGMLEVGCELNDVADNMVSSQSFAPVDGWDYEKILESLVATDGQLNGAQFAESIVESQIKVSSNYNVGGRSMNLSAVDLNEADNLRDLMSDLGKDLYKILDAETDPTKIDSNSAATNAVVIERIKDLIHQSHYYSQTFLHEQAVDILDFMTSLEANCDLKLEELALICGTRPMTGTAQAIEDAFNKIKAHCQTIKTYIALKYVKINKKSGAEYQFSGGVSIFFPWTLLAFNMLYYAYKELKFNKPSDDPNWFSFIEKYATLTLRPRDESRFNINKSYLVWFGESLNNNRASSAKDTDATRASSAKASSAKGEGDPFYKFFGRFRNHPIEHNVP